MTTLFAAAPGMSDAEIVAGVLIAVDHVIEDLLRKFQSDVLARTLDIDVDELDALVAQSRAESKQAAHASVEAILDRLAVESSSSTRVRSADNERSLRCP